MHDAQHIIHGISHVVARVSVVAAPPTDVRHDGRVQCPVKGVVTI